jgi:hypothetical protein
MHHEPSPGVTSMTLRIRPRPRFENHFTEPRRVHSGHTLRFCNQASSDGDHVVSTGACCSAVRALQRDLADFSYTCARTSHLESAGAPSAIRPALTLNRIPNTRCVQLHCARGEEEITHILNTALFAPLAAAQSGRVSVPNDRSKVWPTVPMDSGRSASFDD